LTHDQVNDFIEQIMRLMDLVRGSPNAAYALKTMVNGVAGAATETSVQPEPASSSAVAETDGTGAVQMTRPMSVKEFLKLQQSEAGEKDGDDSPTGGAELCSDAEYFTPLSSPDESRRSSVEILSSEVCIFNFTWCIVFWLVNNNNNNNNARLSLKKP